MKKLYPAVFLDRDGTLCMVREGHVTTLSQFIWLPNVFRDLKRLQDAGFKLICVTNQSAIAKGLTSNSKVRHIHRYMIEECAKHGITLDAVYWCVHDKDDNCDCRKPKPTMLLMAAKDFNIDLDNSYMVGDKNSDGEAGKNAGCKLSIVLKHGETLETAVDIILKDSNQIS